MFKFDNNKKTDLPARERIIFTAHKLFYLEGIRAVGVDRLIVESNVSKATFYRHFPSKNDLIREYLEYRHQIWINWFKDAIQRHGNSINSLVPTLAEWFNDKNFRGCAFINSVGELGESMPEVVDIARNHKQEMTSIIEDLLPSSRQKIKTAQAISLAIDGAIFNAQITQSVDHTLQLLKRIIANLCLAMGSTVK